MGQAVILRAALVVALLGANVHAQPVSRAKELFAKGMRHYDLAEYDAAIAAFREAYQLAPAPGILFNLAQTYRLKGPDGCVLAVRFYKNYLLADPAAKNRPFVEQTLASLEPCEVGAGGAGAAGGAGGAGVEPASQPVAPVASASSPERGPVPEPVPEPVLSSPPPASSATSPVNWRPYAVVAGGAVLTAVGAYLYFDAGSTYADLETECASHTCPRSTWESARTKERVGIGFTVGGIAAAAAGTIWLLTTRGRGESAAAAAAAAGTTTIVPTTNGAALLMTF